MLGEVVAIDLDARRLTVETLGRRSEIAYDSLIVATGASQSYFGHPEFAHDAPGMKTIDDALELRGRIFGAFEMAERETDPAARRRWLTFVVVGAGPTGVELAGQLAELSRRSLRGNFRHIDPAEARVVLLDAAPTILPRVSRVAATAGGAGPARHGRRDPCRHDGHRRRRARARDELHRIRSCGGSRRRRRSGPPGSGLAARSVLADAAGAELDRAGRVKVEADCTLPGHPEVFVIGDLMSLVELPGVAQVAIQSGRHAADTIMRRLAGDTARRPFRYRDFGSMATISRFRAMAAIGRMRVSGFPAWVLWLIVHLVALTGFKHRLSVFFNWTVAFLGRGRAERVITAQQVFGRHALEAHAREQRYCAADINDRSRQRRNALVLRPGFGIERALAAPSHANSRSHLGHSSRTGRRRGLSEMFHCAESPIVWNPEDGVIGPHPSPIGVKRESSSSSVRQPTALFDTRPHPL